MDTSNKKPLGVVIPKQDLYPRERVLLNYTSTCRLRITGRHVKTVERAKETCWLFSIPTGRRVEVPTYASFATARRSINPVGIPFYAHQSSRPLYKSARHRGAPSPYPPSLHPTRQPDDDNYGWRATTLYFWYTYSRGDHTMRVMRDISYRTKILDNCAVI